MTGPAWQAGGRGLAALTLHGDPLWLPRCRAPPGWACRASPCPGPLIGGFRAAFCTPSVLRSTLVGTGPHVRPLRAVCPQPALQRPAVSCGHGMGGCGALSWECPVCPVCNVRGLIADAASVLPKCPTSPGGSMLRECPCHTSKATWVLGAGLMGSGVPWVAWVRRWHLREASVDKGLPSSVTAGVEQALGTRVLGEAR